MERVKLIKVAREIEKIPPPPPESGTFKGKFGTLMWPSGTLMFTFNTLFLNKMPFRPRVVLSMLFVCKIQPEVYSSVCECS